MNPPSQAKARPSRHTGATARKLLAVFTAAVLVSLLVWLGHSIFARKLTSFQAVVDSTSIMFVSGSDLGGSNAGGLLSGPEPMRLTVNGCSHVHYAATSGSQNGTFRTCATQLGSNRGRDSGPHLGGRRPGENALEACGGRLAAGGRRDGERER